MSAGSVSGIYDVRLENDVLKLSEDQVLYRDQPIQNEHFKPIAFQLEHRLYSKDGKLHYEYDGKSFDVDTKMMQRNDRSDTFPPFVPIEKQNGGKGQTVSSDGGLGNWLSKQEIYKAKLPHRVAAAYPYLKKRSNKEGACYQTTGTIAKKLILYVSTVRIAVSVLERNSFICKRQLWHDNCGRSSLLFKIII